MVREFILTTALYNAGVFSVLDFIVQSCEMYKDDVLSWKDGDSLKTVEKFEQYPCSVRVLKNRYFVIIRNIYIHAFDMELDRLYFLILMVYPSDLKQVCEYFGVPFDYKEVYDKIISCRDMLHHMVNLEELNGSKES